MPNQMNCVALFAICVAATLLPGCRYPLGTSYGLSEGTEAHTSPASVSLFRNMCNADGRTTLVVRSFSPRAMTKLNAIVWSPDSFAQHSPETMAWLDRWLASGDKTLVYVGRDFSPMADYWSQSAEELAKEAVSNKDALSAREEQAAAQAQLDKMRSETRAKTATPWCLFDNTQGIEERVNKVNGPWASVFDPSNARLFIRSFPVGYAKRTLGSDKKLFDRESEDISTKQGASVNTAPNAPSTEFDFKWQKSDATMLDYVKALNASELPEMNSYLSTTDDKTLVAEITKSTWGSSRVVVLANASLISNLSLTNSENLAIAKKLLNELPKSNIGFLTGNSDPRVRTDDSSDQQKGFEMLTIWPINVISLHAVILGMLALLAAFPIFGRAKLLPVKSTREFGQHIEAIGGLLFKSQDRSYALATIAEYFRNVRKEPTSPWAKIEPPAQQEPKSPFKLQ